MKIENLWAVQFILVDKLGSSWDRYGEYMCLTFDRTDFERDNFTVAGAIRLLSLHCYNYGGVSLGKDIFISAIETNSQGDTWQTYDISLVKPELTRK